MSDTEDPKPILDGYYAEYDEASRFASRNSSVEQFVTFACIERALEQVKLDFGSGHIPTILEIGAATGAYSLELARQRYYVSAVDLLEQHIDTLRENAAAAAISLDASVADARDLSDFEDESFDIVLCLGPLYHLFTEKDISQAISEAIRVCRKNGHVFLAYLPQDSIVLSYFLRHNKFSECYGTTLSKDFAPVVTPKEIFRGFYIDEFEQIMENFPQLVREHLVSADGMSHQMRESVDDLDDEGYRIWCQYCLHVSERTDLLGYSNHLLWIGKKTDSTEH